MSDLPPTPEELERGFRHLRLWLVLTAVKAWVVAGLVWHLYDGPLWACAAAAVAYSAACLALIPYFRRRRDELAA